MSDCDDDLVIVPMEDLDPLTSPLDSDLILIYRSGAAPQIITWAALKAAIPNTGSGTDTALTSEAVGPLTLGYRYSLAGVATVQNADCTAGSDGTAAPANCLVKLAYGDDVEATVYLPGQSVPGFIGLEPGATYYLGEAGALSLAPPSPGSGEGSQVVGFADSTGTKLFFDPFEIFGM